MMPCLLPGIRVSAGELGRGDVRQAGEEDYPFDKDRVSYYAVCMQDIHNYDAWMVIQRSCEWCRASNV